MILEEEFFKLAVFIVATVVVTVWLFNRPDKTN